MKMHFTRVIYFGQVNQGLKKYFDGSKSRIAATFSWPKKIAAIRDKLPG
jgi:hypothetical protein